MLVIEYGDMSSGVVSDKGMRFEFVPLSPVGSLEDCDQLQHENAMLYHCMVSNLGNLFNLF